MDLPPLGQRAVAACCGARSKVRLAMAAVQAVGPKSPRSWQRTSESPRAPLGSRRAPWQSWRAPWQSRGSWESRPGPGNLAEGLENHSGAWESPGGLGVSLRGLRMAPWGSCRAPRKFRAPGWGPRTESQAAKQADCSPEKGTRLSTRRVSARIAAGSRGPIHGRLARET